MYSLDHSTEPLIIEKWRTPEKRREFQQYLESRVVYHRQQNLNELKSLIDETSELTWKNYEPNFLGFGESSTKRKFLEGSSYASLVFNTFSILVLVYLYLYVVTKD